MKKQIILLLLIAGISFAQEVDTAKIMQVYTLEDSLNNLRSEMKNISVEISLLKKQIAEGNDFDKLLGLLEENEIADVPEEQRSKRKRLDAMLKLLNQRPGTLMFNGTAIALLQNNLSSKKSAGIGVLDIYAHTTFGENILFFSALEFLGGNGLSSKSNSYLPFFANEGSFQDEDGLDRIGLLESWLEFSLLNSGLTITAGKLDLTNYFDNNSYANDETAQFISSNFVNNGTLPFIESTPGVRIRTSLLEYFFVQLALASTSNSGENIFDGFIQSGSVGIKTLSNSDWEGNLRFYGYSFSNQKKSFGFGISYDQTLSEKFGLFFRYGNNNNNFSEIIPIESSYSGGIRIKFGVLSKLGFGYAHNSFYDERINDDVAEIYFRHQFNKWIYLSPHLQFYSRSEGNEKENSFLLGLRTQLNF